MYNRLVKEAGRTFLRNVEVADSGIVAHIERAGSLPGIKELKPVGVAIDALQGPNFEQRLTLLACYAEVYGLRVPSVTRKGVGLTLEFTERSILVAAESKKIQLWFSDIESTLNPIAKRKDNLIIELRNQSGKPLTYAEMSNIAANSLGVFVSTHEVQDVIYRMGQEGRIRKHRDIIHLREEAVKALWGNIEESGLPLTRSEIAKKLTQSLKYKVTVWQVDSALVRLRENEEILPTSAIIEANNVVVQAALPLLKQKDPVLTEVQIAKNLTDQLKRRVTVKQVRNAAMHFISTKEIKRRVRSSQESAELQRALIELRAEGITALDEMARLASERTEQIVSKTSLSWYINRLIKDGRLQRATTDPKVAEKFYEKVLKVAIGNPGVKYRIITQILTTQLGHEVEHWKVRNAIFKLQKRGQLPKMRKSRVDNLIRQAIVKNASET